VRGSWRVSAVQCVEVRSDYVTLVIPLVCLLILERHCFSFIPTNGCTNAFLKGWTSKDALQWPLLVCHSSSDGRTPIRNSGNKCSKEDFYIILIIIRVYLMYSQSEWKTEESSFNSHQSVFYQVKELSNNSWSNTLTISTFLSDALADKLGVNVLPITYNYCLGFRSR